MKKFFVFYFSLVIFITLFSSQAFAAVGQVMPNAESGWKRIDGSNPKFSYVGSWAVSSDLNCYDTTYHQATTISDKVKFSFNGTKLRILSATYAHYPETMEIYIDGIKHTFPLNSTSGVQYQTIVFEKTGLTAGTHKVEISQPTINNATIGFILDAVDIDDTGSLVDPNTFFPLNASGGNSKVDLSWDSLTGATSYVIKRSTNSNGPFSQIATNVAGTTYTDTAVTNGTTYYYIAIGSSSGGEIGTSNVASATPTAPIITPPTTGGNRAILTIIMDTGLEKEFDLSMGEVNSFISWYETKATGSGPATYAINKGNNNKGPFSVRRDYIVFGKVVSFEVSEYTN